MGQGGTITGRVTDSNTLSPISGAQVLADGTNIAALSDAQGRYTLTGVPAGPRTIRAEFLGYAPLTQEVTVLTGQTINLNLGLSVQAILMDELVVTHVGDLQRRREVANAVASIGAAEVTEVAPVNSMANLIQGRAAGVTIQSSSGVTGTGSKIRIRGSSSISLNNAPLVYVDGARVTSTERGSTLNLGGQTVSRLDDLNPDEIESIEIVRGPAAATLYGTQAANGVIRITTKRGQGRGTSQSDVWSEFGVVQDRNDYPAVWRAVTSSGAQCVSVNFALGLCSQAEVRSFNLLTDPSTRPFRTGKRYSLGANTSATPTAAISYFLSAEHTREEGTLPNNDYTGTTFRANLTLRPNQRVSLDVSSGYIASRLRLPNNDNSSLGIQAQGLLGGEPSPTGWWQFSPQQLFLMKTYADVDRFTGSVAGTWDPLGWLSMRSSLGLDVTNQLDTQFIPPGEIPRGRDVLGNRNANQVHYNSLTMDLSASANFAASDRITSRTSVGLQYYHDRRTGVLAFGEELVAGTNSLSAAAATQSDEFTVESKTLGAYVQQQFGLNDRLFITAAVRGDDNSAFGENFSAVLYPKFSASWVVSDEPFFGDPGILESLRLRTAYGQSGNQPGVTDALLYLTGLAVTTSDAENAIGVSYLGGGLGNPDLKPERSSEFEVGVDATLGSRTTFELTFYEKRTKDALIFRNLPPSLGTVPGRWENLGHIRNRGVEVGADAVLLATSAMNVGLGVQASKNTNELMELGEGVAPLGTHREGYPLGGAWAIPVTSWADANGDGIIVATEVTVGTEEAFLGVQAPPNQVTVTPRITLFQRVNLSALFDYQGGHVKNNNTGSFRCSRANDRARNDPTVDGWEQARCVATVFHGTSAGYWEDASFMKLREVSVSFIAPPQVAAMIGASNARVTLSGRNLLTITDYTGVDPEITRQAESEFSTQEFLTQAPSRYLILRVNPTF
jgi:TonB-linked SusC/RagA family outer membrane protein